MNTDRKDRFIRNAGLPQFKEALERLCRQAAEAEAIPYAIGPQEEGDWGHYYYCPHDGTKLSFDWSAPRSHRCSCCSAEWTGSPYNGAWVTFAHTQIGRGVYYTAYLHAIDPDHARLEKAVRVLLAYARHYEGYKEHGGIPYNGPGKLFAQTLDEAHWIMDLAVGYSLLRKDLTPEQDSDIRTGLFLPCARFLIERKEKQIHNHAVLITSAIASLGIILEDPAIQTAGLTEEYGLYDQLLRGVSEEGLWYEGNIHYHFYALEALLHYAYLVEGTASDLWQRNVLKRMFDFPLNFIQPDGSFPMWNDASSATAIGTYAPFYEIALDRFGDESYRALLRSAYGMERGAAYPYDTTAASRDSLYALLYGKDLAEGGDTAGQLAAKASASRSFPASGYTKLTNRKGWQAIIKHSIFGGEHDHMDRLGLSFRCGAVPVLEDPGTVAYGVPAHYGWFKHTYSHNTIVLNGADQPPRDGVLVQFHERDWGIWSETAVDWKSGNYKMQDRIALPPEMCPWDHAAYHGASYRRINLLTEELLLDIFEVRLPESRDIELASHISGELSLGGNASWQPTNDMFGRLDQRWFNDKRILADRPSAMSYKLRQGRLVHRIWCSQPATAYSARTPDNPPTSDRQTVIFRVPSRTDVLFIQAFTYVSADGEIEPEGALEVNDRSDGLYDIRIDGSGASGTYSLDLRAEAAKLVKCRFHEGGKASGHTVVRSIRP